MLQYSNLMTGSLGLYYDVLVAVGFTCCQINQITFRSSFINTKGTVGH